MHSFRGAVSRSQVGWAIFAPPPQLKMEKKFWKNKSLWGQLTLFLPISDFKQAKKFKVGKIFAKLHLFGPFFRRAQCDDIFLGFDFVFP